MNHYSLLFYAKKTKGNPEFSAIYLRLTVSGKRTELSTGQTILTSSWNPEAGKVSGNTKEIKSINSYIENIRLKILQINNDLLACKKEVTGEILKNRYLGTDEKKMTIVEVFKDHNHQMKDLIGKSFAKGTWERDARTVMEPDMLRSTSTEHGQRLEDSAGSSDCVPSLHAQGTYQCPGSETKTTWATRVWLGVVILILVVLSPLNLLVTLLWIALVAFRRVCWLCVYGRFALDRYQDLFEDDVPYILNPL